MSCSGEHGAKKYGKRAKENLKKVSRPTIFDVKKVVGVNFLACVEVLKYGV